jgi:hypothetical protein
MHTEYSYLKRLENSYLEDREGDGSIIYLVAWRSIPGWEQDVFLLSTESTLALRITQPPIQWVMATLFVRCKADGA